MRSLVEYLLLSIAGVSVALMVYNLALMIVLGRRAQIDYDPFPYYRVMIWCYAALIAARMVSLVFLGI